MNQLLLLPLELAIAFGPPALIARFAPSRWRLPAVLMWAFAPVLVGLGMAATEMASAKAAPGDIDKLIFGLLLIGSVVLLPWLGACAIGYALGAWWRIRGDNTQAPEPARAEAVSALRPAPPAPYSPRVDPDAPTLAPRSGWEAAHVGVANDGLVLDGLPVWSLAWREEAGAEAVTLDHPAHPGQRHAFTIYNVDDGARATRFAAAELSNGVWGFYRWIVPVDLTAGVSDDGSLRYENDFGPDDGDRPSLRGALAKLYDARTDGLLFDGAAWHNSRVVPRPDGGLLLTLEERDLHTLFHIDPASGAFHDVEHPAARRPLTELREASAASRAACDDPDLRYAGRRIAPDGSLKVELAWQEWGNSHWVRAPRVIEIATGRILLDLWGTDWDAEASFPQRRRAVRLRLRRYHHGGDADVEIEAAPDRYILREGPETAIGDLAALPAALAAAARRSVARRPARPPVARPKLTARNWLVALGILVGALALIAVATVVSLRLERKPPPPRLDTVPAIPQPTPMRSPDTGRR